MGPLRHPRSTLRRAAASARSRLPARRQRPERKLYQVLYEFGRVYPEAVFVQVGANDGLTNDPLHQEILERRWTGVMVEPVPYLFERLRQNFGHLQRVRLENAAIADHDGTQPLHFVAPAEDGSLPEWAEGLGSFRKDVVVGHRDRIPDIEARLQTIEVPCLTIETLCRKHGIAALDLLQTDTEGYDAQILGTLDLERTRPTLVMFENYHMDPATHRACVSRFEAHGYEELSDGMDTICLRLGALRHGERRLLRLWERLRSEPPDSVPFAHLDA
jgi:FkbM family methyltransferase